MADVDKVKAIAKEWEDRTKLELEFDVYKHGRLVQKDVNNYLLIDLDDGHYKCKGAYVKKLSSIDYDLPILNKAIVNYFVHDIPVEKTINDATELIEFQKVIKLTSLYKGVVYGEGKKIKGTDGKEKVMVENGIPLKEKVHRVFASTRKEDKVVFVSIDNPKRWSEWHSGSTDSVYYSDFLNENEDVNIFLEQVKHDYPDNNLSDDKCNHEYYIKYVVLDYNKNDVKGFETLCRMMRAYSSYNNRR